MNFSKSALQGLAIGALCLTVVATTYAQNLVRNGSFETPISNNQWMNNPTSWYLGQTFDGGWYVEQWSIDIKRLPSTDGIHVPAFHGAQWLDLNGFPRQSD